MTVRDHPDTALLHDYLHDAAAAEFSSLRLHLAVCSHCRGVVEGLTGLQDISQENPVEDALTELQLQHIADYIDGSLGAADQQQQKDFIQSSSAAMKAALHYASHKSAMDKAVLKPLASAQSEKHVVAVRNKIPAAWLGKLKSLLAFQAPVWFTVPATAALVALISINIVNQPVSENNLYTIANYQDNAIIQFRSKNTLPGIGFFTKSSQVSEPYSAVSVSVTDSHHIKIKWPPVSGALNYTLRLQMFNQGSKTLLGEITTDNTFASINTKLDTLYHRYEWVLSGETNDNRVFMSSGGFVINKPDKGVLR